MSSKARFGWAILPIFVLNLVAMSQSSARLHTSDTEIVLEAGSSAPRLVSLTDSGQTKWENRSSEALIPSADIADKPTPLQWTLNREASQISEQRAAFVYDSTSPHLRLTWEWRIRQAYGPIEHEIRIENLDNSEIWIPFQDSLALNLRIDPQSSLEHFFVEKGANTPSPIGTHQVPLAEGYQWTGTSSTYGDLDNRDPREIIPWSLVQDKTQSGWYAGIEFSGRTRISLQRKQDSLNAAFGLNPDPGPFRTRLGPGEVFETPIVFLGGFRDGPDGAGNILRRWVRTVLGNPETWKDQNYPLVVNNSWGGGMDVNEEIALRMIRDSADMGVDMFHVDAGWFRNVGDWYPNPQKFPHGLAVIADDAHKHGLKFGLWVDWTQAGLSTERGALNARDPKVRDWMVTDVPVDWQPEPFKGQTIDLGVPEAKQWAQNEVERIVTDYHLDMLEHDGYLVAHGCVGQEFAVVADQPAAGDVERQPHLAAARGAHVCISPLRRLTFLDHHAGIGLVDVDQHLLHRLLAVAGLRVAAGQHARPADGQFEALAAHLLDQHAKLQFAAAGDLERVGLVRRR